VIVSNDSIMYPPYNITNEILHLLTSISEKLGAIDAIHIDRPAPQLRKQNKVKSIQASLEIEGNTLSEEQITAILNNQRVIGPQKDIQEVLNAIKVYESLNTFNSTSLQSFLAAHEMLLANLIANPGTFRKKSVGIVKGSEVAHLAPPFDNVPHLMKDLFIYLSSSNDPILIKSCVVHYEIEFIHPFMDGNGRMGRLWQTIILMEKYPVFEYIPFETIIKERQKEYYETLAISDKQGKSTVFIEFMLSAINEALSHFLHFQNRILTSDDRISYFLETYEKDAFTRKDYMNTFKDISTSTASRDLKAAVEKSQIQKNGDKNTTIYLKR